MAFGEAVPLPCLSTWYFRPLAVVLISLAAAAFVEPVAGAALVGSEPAEGEGGAGGGDCAARSQPVRHAITARDKGNINFIYEFIRTLEAEGLAVKANDYKRRGCFTKEAPAVLVFSHLSLQNSDAFSPGQSRLLR